jgi:hypothetical protein
MTPNNFGTLIVDALLYVLSAIGRILLLPYSLWTRAISRLAEQRQEGYLTMSNITSKWPFLSFCKRLIIDFTFDAVSFLSYPLGGIFAVAILSVDLARLVPEGYPADEIFLEFIGTLIAIYIYPVLMSVTHDFCELLMLPIRKAIDFFKKPAQQINVDYKERQE